jgi:hypothetical protein
VGVLCLKVFVAEPFGFCLALALSILLKLSISILPLGSDDKIDLSDKDSSNERIRAEKSKFLK